MSHNRTAFFVALHIIFWGALITLPYFMVPSSLKADVAKELANLDPNNQPDWARITLLAALPFNISLILFYYLHHYILFDKLARNRRFVVYALSIVFSFLFVLAIGYYSKRGLFPGLPVFLLTLTVSGFVRYLTWFLLILLISIGNKLLTQLQEAERRTGAIETEQLRTELAMLHAQVNPHFLFNSLNTIYSLALKKSDLAPLAILKLSHLMRYLVEEANYDKVPLEHEVNYLNNYIELQKLRHTNNTTVNFNIAGNIATTSVAPLLFLPFVENAFKYGISSSEPSPVDIELKAENRQIMFSVVNKKFKQAERPSTRTGINNVQRRLELLYPGDYALLINDVNGVYSVNLTINLV